MGICGSKDKEKVVSPSITPHHLCDTTLQKR